MTENDHDENVIDTEADINRTLFVSSLAPEATEDILRELFMQAGPVEKVTIPQNKRMAFVLYKHSISVPYAKELFYDTRLFGKYLVLNFRHGSIHFEQKKAPQQQRYQYQPTRDNSNYSNGNSHDTVTTYGKVIDHDHQMHQGSHAQHIGRYHSGATARHEDRFQSTPSLHVQGYRTFNESREYVPEFVRFDNPPDNFMGAAPVNQPGHVIDLEERRHRLRSQQHYLSEADIQRQNRHQDRRKR